MGKPTTSSHFNAIIKSLSDNSISEAELDKHLIWLNKAIYEYKKAKHQSPPSLSNIKGDMHTIEQELSNGADS